MGSCMFCCLYKGESIVIVHFGKHYNNAYKDFTYNDFTYIDFTYNDCTYNINKCDITYMFYILL